MTDGQDPGSSGPDVKGRAATRTDRATSPLRFVAPTVCGTFNIVIVAGTSRGAGGTKPRKEQREEKEEPDDGRKARKEKPCRNDNCPTRTKQAAAREPTKPDKPFRAKRNPLALLRKAVLNAFGEKDACKLTESEKKRWKRMRSGDARHDEKLEALDKARCRARKKSAETQYCSTRETPEERDPFRGRKLAETASCIVIDCPIAAKRRTIDDYGDRTPIHDRRGPEGAFKCTRFDDRSKGSDRKELTRAEGASGTDKEGRSDATVCRNEYRPIEPRAKPATRCTAGDTSCAATEIEKQSLKESGGRARVDAGTEAAGTSGLTTETAIRSQAHAPVHADNQLESAKDGAGSGHEYVGRAR